MRRLLRSSLAACLLLGCQSKPEPGPSAPLAPSPAPASRALLAPRAVIAPATNRPYGITLTCDPNPSAASFKVYTSGSDGRTAVSNFTANLFPISTLWHSNTYTFLATAIDDSGLESDPSNPVTWPPPATNVVTATTTLLSRPDLASPWAGVLTVTRSWTNALPSMSFFSGSSAIQVTNNAAWIKSFELPQ
jgi:hypothetical protein